MEKERYLFSIFNSIRTPVLVIGRDLHIFDLNKAACLQFGLKRDQAIGRYCYEIAHARSRPCFESDVPCPVQQVFETGRPTRVIHRHSLPEGKSAIEEVIASPLEDDDGRVLFVVEELRDASELLKTREVVEELRSELKTLQGILPICAGCKKIRRSDGAWESVESYIRDRSEATFTHGICPDCTEKMLP